MTQSRTVEPELSAPLCWQGGPQAGFPWLQTNGQLERSLCSNGCHGQPLPTRRGPMDPQVLLSSANERLRDPALGALTPNRAALGGHPLLLQQDPSSCPCRGAGRAGLGPLPTQVSRGGSTPHPSRTSVDSRAVGPGLEPLVSCKVRAMGAGPAGASQVSKP